MKTLSLFLVAFAALATPLMAAPVPGAPASPERSGMVAIPVGQNVMPNSGEVTEAVAAGPYTYLHVTKDGKETWLAIPRREVPVGAEIQYGEGSVMKDFRSNSLDRTFDEVLFLGGIMMAGEEPLAAPAGHPTVPADPAAQENLPNAGKVSESLAAGSYTYLHVAGDGGEAWLAIPRRDVPVGAEIRYANGMMMKDFHSRSLDRTFKEVYFLGGVMVMTE